MEKIAGNLCLWKILKMVYISKKICTYPGCGRPHNSKGYCSGHRAMQLKGKELRPLLVRDDYHKNKSTICSIEGCERKIKSKGYCSSHYNRIVWHGLDSKVGTRSIIYPEICIYVDCYVIIIIIFYDYY